MMKHHLRLLSFDRPTLAPLTLDSLEEKKGPRSEFA